MNLFEGPENQISTFGKSPDGVHKVWLPFCGENKK
jgi:hypothetical protein